MAPDHVAEDVLDVLGLVDRVEDCVHRRGPDLLAGLDELDELVDDRARLGDVDVVARDRQPVPAQQDGALEAVAERVEHAVADRGQLGSDVVGDVEGLFHLLHALSVGATLGLRRAFPSPAG